MRDDLDDDARERPARSSSPKAPDVDGARDHGDTGVPLVPAARPTSGVTDRVLAVLAEVEAQTGPRLELVLIRAQLTSPTDNTAQADLAGELATKFPDALAARVATARRALAGGDDRAIRRSLELLAGEQGQLAWALRGRWQCGHCGNRPGPFSWRCGQCRRWATMRMETGIEPPPIVPRERREVPRARGSTGCSARRPIPRCPRPRSIRDLPTTSSRAAGTRRSLLGRVGGWFSGVWRRSP